MKYPNKIYVFECDWDVDENQPLYAVATTLDEIPEDQHGNKVGIYTLDCTSTITITRTILSGKKGEP